MKNSLLIFLLVATTHLWAEDSLVCKLNMATTYFTTDQYLNVYFINQKNEIVKYNILTQASMTFSDKELGKPTYIDATNPLKILVLYPDFSSIALLDNKLSELTVIQFNAVEKGPAYKPVTACKEEQGDNFWIYDELSRKLMQFDEIGNKLSESEAFDQLFDDAPDPTQLIYAAQKLYAYDKKKGLYVFDLFGNFLMSMDIRSDSQLQIESDQLISILDHTLKIFDLHTNSTFSQPIEFQDVMQINVQSKYIFYRAPASISVYMHGS